jgi:aryl-alcohol dehydrogenase-like predicted oxidoreductase
MYISKYSTPVVIATAQEVGIAVLGYSPIAHGFFTSSPVEKPEDLASMSL